MQTGECFSLEQTHVCLCAGSPIMLVDNETVRRKCSRLQPSVTVLTLSTASILTLITCSQEGSTLARCDDPDLKHIIVSQQRGCSSAHNTLLGGESVQHGLRLLQGCSHSLLQISPSLLPPANVSA